MTVTSVLISMFCTIHLLQWAVLEWKKVGLVRFWLDLTCFCVGWALIKSINTIFFESLFGLASSSVDYLTTRATLRVFSTFRVISNFSFIRTFEVKSVLKIGNWRICLFDSLANLRLLPIAGLGYHVALKNEILFAFLLYFVLDKVRYFLYFPGNFDILRVVLYVGPTQLLQRLNPGGEGFPRLPF